MCSTATLSALLPAQASFDRLLRAAGEPQNWLTYNGNLQSTYYRRLTEITSESVANLNLKREGAITGKI